MGKIIKRKKGTWLKLMIKFSGNSSKKTTLRTRSKPTFFWKIDNYVRTQKIYLQPTLSLHCIANTFGISEGYLSQLINHFSGQNFSTYINDLRVEEAKKKLVDSHFRHYTIVSIGLESGFNSKSAFYKAFKKKTGMTPTEYILKLRRVS